MLLFCFRHSKELIQKLEQAGLGYHVDADETVDRLGKVPMRRLVSYMYSTIAILIFKRETKIKFAFP